MEQWIIMTGMEGEFPDDFVGPFPTKEAALQWMDDNGSYLDARIDDILDEWKSGNPDETFAPTVGTWAVFVNTPASVASTG